MGPVNGYLLNPMDQLHERAVGLRSELEAVQLVTSDFVLSETLNFMSKLGSQLRRKVSGFMVQLVDNPNADVRPARRDLFLEGLQLFQKRQDKQWSHVDCTSILLMKQLGLQEVLTSDRHFKQAGFTVLLPTASD